ncbi:protein of unknown function [Candidatus Methylocalor cossyra]|uniref:Transposase n=1 Tax=Candidatus Methylocalor cossyra TaxID=3108543 RepID=A0ABM9NK84_9GAMM
MKRQASPARTEPIHLVIRGITAPASLKQEAEPEYLAELFLRYPGHNCPGLIEACEIRKPY